MDINPLNRWLKNVQGKWFGGNEGAVNKEQMAFMRRLQKDLQRRDVLVTSLNRLEVIAIDLETTGFEPEKGDEIIAIGALKIKGKEIVPNESFYSLVQPKKFPSQEILDLTGITKAELERAPTVSDGLFRFFQFAKHHPLIAHHAAHEKKFLQYASENSFRLLFQNKIFDTSILFRTVEPMTRLKTLDEWCAHNDIPIRNRHHALSDAKMAAELWCRYIDRAEKLGFRNLLDIYEHIAKTVDRND
ncbi:exonuclease domain-containing protein [Fervidibacillus albus]|uniref:Exonuclease domain-containing protein n=1 Tax=Fervidibacillus albus TaxID=2980026 RepID=A0A9E8RVQ2_9BACI|nr:exonuclease domain-containing protein [Fervidibacillus albus]WAA10920.1 exonuclease domain-containing protein [Fervidibacillus albus]